jgi:hypothetical protein
MTQTTVLETKFIAYHTVARLGVQPNTDVVPPQLKAHEGLETGISYYIVTGEASV